MFSREYSIAKFLRTPIRLFYKQHLYEKQQAKISKKIKQRLSNNLRLNFCYLKIIRFSLFVLNVLKTSVSDCMIIMKMRLRMKNSLHRYDIDRTRPKHGYTYTKYKTCLSMMMVMFNKQHLSNILR